MAAVAIVFLTVILDQISKYIVASNMTIGQTFNLIPNILNITYITNTGAAFGMFQNHRWVFLITSSVAILCMIAFLCYLILKKQYGFMRIALGFMIGGGIGNMIDRLGAGAVVDFLEFDFVTFAVFNLADTFVCVGTAVFCISIIVLRNELFESGKKVEE